MKAAVHLNRDVMGHSFGSSAFEMCQKWSTEGKQYQVTWQPPEIEMKILINVRVLSRIILFFCCCWTNPKDNLVWFHLEFLLVILKSRWKQVEMIQPGISIYDLEVKTKAAWDYSTRRFVFIMLKSRRRQFRLNLEMSSYFGLLVFVAKGRGHETWSLSTYFSTGSLVCRYPITITFSYLISRCLVTSTVGAKQKQ